LIAYCRQFPSPMTLMIDRLRVCAFVSRIELAVATWCAWLLYLRRRLCSLLPRWLLLSSSSILDSSSGSLKVYRCLVIVTGRVAWWNCASRTLLLATRFCSLVCREFCAHPFVPLGGFVDGSLWGSAWWCCLLFGKCSRALSGLLGA
jgi:hypothetical protein